MEAELEVLVLVVPPRHLVPVVGGQRADVVRYLDVETHSGEVSVGRGEGQEPAGRPPCLLELALAAREDGRLRLPQLPRLPFRRPHAITLLVAGDL